MPKRSGGVAAAPLAAVFLACGGGQPETRAFDPQSQIAVSIRPESAAVAAGGTLTFTAVVTGAADSSVAWSLAEGAAAGTISTGGAYTAPATGGTYHVIATANADRNRSASATVVVSVAKAPRIDVSIDPPSATLEPGATAKFTATVIGSSDAAVTWSADGGAVDAAGFYTAPAGEGVFHVQATSRADPSRTASATVTVRGASVAVAVAISPRTAQILTGGRQPFAATVTGSADARVSWSIAEGATGGAIDASGAYTAPESPGTFHVVATSVASPAATDTAVVTVTRAVCVPTTCSAQHATCGSISDGCGGTLDCGPCAAGSVCADASAPHHTVTQCGEINAPGCYTLSRHLESLGGPCLTVRDTSAVELDCRGAAVQGGPAIQISNVSALEVHGCKLASPAGLGVNISGSSDVTIDHNDLPVGLQALNTTRLTVASNTVGYEILLQYGQNIVVRDNTITLAPSSNAIPGLVYAQYGSGTQILRNKMDGAWDGHNQAGADDGIILWDEHDDVVDGNAISNVYDCGIETLGLIANTSLSNNTIQHSGICGIGAWYYNSWRGNRISGNRAESTLQLFDFLRLGSLRPVGFDPQHRMPADTAIEFHDNVFERNSYTNPSGGLPSSSIPLYGRMLYSPGASVFTVPGQRDPNTNEWNLLNNTFTGNQFGTATQAPSFGLDKVPGAVVDGGGNVCGAPPSTPYPLLCGN